MSRSPTAAESVIDRLEHVPFPLESSAAARQNVPWRPDRDQVTAQESEGSQQVPEVWTVPLQSLRRSPQWDRIKEPLSATSNSFTQALFIYRKHLHLDQNADSTENHRNSVRCTPVETRKPARLLERGLGPQQAFCWGGDHQGDFKHLWLLQRSMLVI